MRNRVVVALGVSMLLLAPVQGFGQGAPDHYANTTFGPVTFVLNGAQLTGDYPKFNGRLYMRRVSGAFYSGQWVQPRSDQRCDRPVQGSYYWGNVSMTFPGNNTFQGEWGYCTDKPESPWNGRKN